MNVLFYTLQSGLAFFPSHFATSIGQGIFDVPSFGSCVDEKILLTLLSKYLSMHFSCSMRFFMITELHINTYMYTGSRAC